MKPTRQFFLEANPNPERQGCPDEKTLKDIAENRLPADHPARLHLASCSPCFAEFRSFKGQFEAKRAVATENSGVGYRGLLARGGRPLRSEDHRQEVRWKRCNESDAETRLSNWPRWTGQLISSTMELSVAEPIRTRLRRSRFLPPLCICT